MPEALVQYAGTGNIHVDRGYVASPRGTHGRSGGVRGVVRLIRINFDIDCDLQLVSHESHALTRQILDRCTASRRWRATA